MVFSLDRPPIDAPPDPGTDMVTARFIRRQVEDEGAPFRDTQPQDVTASVVLENGARPLVEQEGDTFRFAWTRGMTYHLTFDRGQERSPLTFVANTEQLRHVQRTHGREGKLTQPGTRLDVTFENLGTAALLGVVTTGVWSFWTDQVSTPLVLEWPLEVRFLGGRSQILEARDSVYCLEYDEVIDSGLQYRAVSRWGKTSVTMDNGAVTTLACTLVERPLEKCARIEIDRAAELARLDGLLAPTFDTTSFASFVLATPEAAYGPWASTWLALQTGSGPITPFSGTLHYTNPFASSSEAVQSVMFRVRYVKARGAMKAIPLPAGTSHFYRPTENCGAVAPIAQIAVPSPPAFGGAFLVTDAELQLSRTQPIHVSWETRTPGAVDYYLLQLYELVLDPDTLATVLVEKHAWVSTMQEMMLGRDTFEANREYVMSVSTLYGFVGTENGDFGTTRWPSPVASATNYSGVFTVKP